MFCSIAQVNWKHIKQEEANAGVCSDCVVHGFQMPGEITFVEGDVGAQNAPQTGRPATFVTQMPTQWHPVHIGTTAKGTTMHTVVNSRTTLILRHCETEQKLMQSINRKQNISEELYTGGMVGQKIWLAKACRFD